MTAAPLTPGQGLVIALDNLEHVMDEREKELAAARTEVERLKSERLAWEDDRDKWVELATRMRPVVEAAMAWQDVLPSIDGREDRALEAAVDAYRAQEEVMPNAAPLHSRTEDGRHAVTGAAHPSPRDEALRRGLKPKEQP